MQDTSGEINDIDPKDLMAVERSTTALIGTSISLIMLGFVVEKFELFLHLIAPQMKKNMPAVLPQLSHIQFYNALGILIVSVGIILSLYTYHYYTRWIKHLEQKRISTDKNIYFLLSLFIALIGFVLIFSMIIL